MKYTCALDNTSKINTKNIVRSSLIITMSCIGISYTRLLGGMIILSICIVLLNFITEYKHSVVASIILPIYTLYIGSIPVILRQYTVLIIISNIIYSSAIKLITSKESTETILISSTIGTIAGAIIMMTIIGYQKDYIMNLLILELCTITMFSNIIGGILGERIYKLLKRRNIINNTKERIYGRNIQ